MAIDFLKNDNEYRTLDHDFKNLKNLEVSENNEKSLNLGSEYSQNEYQFDDKVSSVQRDLSLENCTDEYNSILNSSDVSNSENNNSLKKKNNKIGGLSKNKSKAQLGGLQGMARIKSSVKLFTVDDNEEPDNEEEKILGGKLIHKKKKKNPNDSVSISDLSTGDSAYPVLAFKSRIIKEFEPKVSIFSINMKQLEIQSNFSKVPRHTKLRYEEPIHCKEVNSPPIECSFDNGIVSPKETKLKTRSRIQMKFNNKLKRETFSSESPNDSSIDEGFAKSLHDASQGEAQSRIQRPGKTMPVNKPFCRQDYTKPKSMIIPSLPSTYIHVRKRRTNYINN